jgi:hypothetical protein
MADFFYYVQLAFEATVGVFGIRTYEEPAYAVLETPRPGLEIRRYAPRLAAQVDLPGVSEAARSEAFRILFRYIAGANSSAQLVAMTTPVAAEAGAEKVAMTTPVATQASGNGVRMQFFLPARLTAATAPRPTDERVHIVPVPEETVAALRFSGRATEEELARRNTELLAAIAAARWQPTGNPVEMFYDAPFTLPFLRRNEVAVSVSPL